MVWLVMAQEDHEGSDVVSVHEDHEGAQKHAEKLTAAMVRASRRRSAWTETDESYAKPQPRWPKGVPDCDTITVSGPWTVR